MDRDQFWEIIDRSRRQAAEVKRDQATDFLDVHIAKLADELRKLPPEEVISFDHHFTECMEEAYRWDLWGAAYWLHGGCGDDGFTDFRSCLISTGKENFYRVLAHPDDVAELEGKPDIPYLQSEGFQYVAGTVYREMTGDCLPCTVSGSAEPREPVGQRYDFEDEEEVARRYPKLYAKYPDMGD